MHAVPLAAPLLLSEYIAVAKSTDRFTEVADGLAKLEFGFFGEIGGLLAALKKVNRDRLEETETEVAGEEIGDALWYLFAVANKQQIAADALGAECLAWLHLRFEDGEGVFAEQTSFRQIDGYVSSKDQSHVGQQAKLLGELARMSGEVIRVGANPQLPLNPLPPTKLYGQLLGMLSLIAASFMLRLEDIARDNINKTQGRWPGPKREYTKPFDSDYLEHEQLPRILEIEFIERKASGATYVVQRLKGVYIGDRLTDNSNEPDDYRFHDVFHLAYVAHLSWSPVVRALLKRKRKSRSDVDENEDGARAMIIEEGIATWIFNHAKKRRMYEDVEQGKLEYALLKQIQSMVYGYEVAACPLWQWEQAILDGFRIFRELQRPENRGGTVVADMNEHTLKFIAPPPKQA